MLGRCIVRGAAFHLTPQGRKSLIVHLFLYGPSLGSKPVADTNPNSGVPGKDR
jgi:hypothetical protein